MHTHTHTQPQVFDEYKAFHSKYGDLIEKLPTRAFLAPLEEDEEVEVEFAKGVGATIKYKAMGELQPNCGWLECLYKCA